jgi:hypothetical protein
VNIKCRDRPVVRGIDGGRDSDIAVDSYKFVWTSDPMLIEVGIKVERRRDMRVIALGGRQKRRKTTENSC